MGVGLLFEVNIVGHSQAVETLNCSCIYVQSCGYARSVCQEVIKPVIFLHQNLLVFVTETIPQLIDWHP